MAQTIEQFGQTIKKKYPQYSDIPDAELGQKMLVKYPQYKDMVAESAPEKKGGDFLDKAESVVGDTFYGRQVGNAIGSLAGYGITAAGEKLGMMPKGSTEQYDLKGPSPLQLAGDIAGGALMIGGLKTPLPVATSLPGAIGKSALQFGALSAGTGASKAATKTSGSIVPTAEDLKKVASSAFWSGLTGAVVGGLTGAATYGLQKLAKAGPEALYNNAMNVSSKIKAAGKSPAKFMADEGAWGSLGTMSKRAQEGITEESAKIAQKVADVSADSVTPTSGELYSQIKDKAAESLSKKFGNLYSRPAIEKMIDSVPLSGINLSNPSAAVDLKTIDSTRSQLGRLVGDTKWLQTNPTESTSAAQAVYGALSNYVKDASETTEEFARLSNWIEAKKAIGKALLLADKKWLPGFYDWTSGALGTVLGSLGGNPVGGGLLAVGLERAARSPAVLTGGAQLLKNPAIAPAIGKVAQTVLPQAIGKIVGQ